MHTRDYNVLNRFRVLLQERVALSALAAFGSRVRTENIDTTSDLDVLVVTETLTPQIRRFVSDCAFEAGFEDGVLVSPVVFSRDEWEHQPESASPLAQTIRSEGVFFAV